MSTSNHEPSIQDSVRYLESDDAIRSIETNPYWPKWSSPWWQMSVLFEMGLANRIPGSAARKMLSEVKRTHLPYFFREEAPADKGPDQDAPCPCALGNIYQILNAAGLDVDAELPWARGWFVKYQMSDGGLSCDEDAYKADPGASSMVGTIAPLEAILSAPGGWTAEEECFLDRGAACLIIRELRLGSSSRFNAEERLDEEDWLRPCFPRFYFYDVLRGLDFLLQWSEKRRKALPAQAIEAVVAALEKKFPDGSVRVERQAFEGVGSRVLAPSGEWGRSSTASTFPLLTEVSRIGQASPYLTQQWREAKERIAALSREGFFT